MYGLIVYMESLVTGGLMRYFNVYKLIVCHISALFLRGYDTLEIVFKKEFKKIFLRRG